MTTQNSSTTTLSTERITLPYLTKYEKARLLGARAHQLSLNAPSTLSAVTLEGLEDPLQIATLELANGVLPLDVVRRFPDGHEETWHAFELKILR